MAVSIYKQWFLDRMVERGVSLTSVAVGLGIDKSALSRALDGKRQVKPLEIGKIATMLGATREDVIRQLEGIANTATRSTQDRQRNSGRLDTGPKDRSGGANEGVGSKVEAVDTVYRKVGAAPAKLPLAGFGEDDQAEIARSTRPRHPGIGFMKGLIKFAPGFDGTGPYSDEPWGEGYLGEDRLTQDVRKARSK